MESHIIIKGRVLGKFRVPSQVRIWSLITSRKWSGIDSYWIKEPTKNGFFLLPCIYEDRVIKYNYMMHAIRGRVKSKNKMNMYRRIITPIGTIHRCVS